MSPRALLFLICNLPMRVLITPDLTHLELGAINIKGVKFNTPFLHDFLDLLDICCISEHWLHNYDLYMLNNVHPDFHAWGIASPNEEDAAYCAPRFCRGHGDVAIFWRKSLNGVQKLKQFANHRCVGITLDNNTSVFSVYLPTRSGCTDNFNTLQTRPFWHRNFRR